MSDEPSPEPNRTRGSIVWLAIAVEGGLILLAIALGRRVDQPPLTHSALTIEGLLWGVAATVPMVLLFLAMVRWPVGPLRSIQRFTDETMVPMLAPCSLIDLIGISCLAGLGEEMLFRGVVQDALLSYVPWWGALLLASVLFGLLHAVTPAYAVLATLMGIYLGGLYLLTRNLLAPIVTHALYDLVVLVYLLRYDPK